MDPTPPLGPPPPSGTPSSHVSPPPTTQPVALPPPDSDDLGVLVQATADTHPAPRVAAPLRQPPAPAVMPEPPPPPLKGARSHRDATLISQARLAGNILRLVAWFVFAVAVLVGALLVWEGLTHRAVTYPAASQYAVVVGLGIIGVGGIFWAHTMLLSVLARYVAWRVAQATTTT